MALPSVGGGQQIGDGNTGEVQLGVQASPQTATVTATLTVPQLLGGLLVGSPGASAASYTLPTVATLEAVLVNAKADSSFDFRLINLGTASGVITMVGGGVTGWTVVGLATTPIAATQGSSSKWLARCVTPGSAWTLYRIS
jgi:hypothetical protein